MSPLVWQVWPSQLWPASKAQEEDFVAQLHTDAPGPSDTWNRPDVTCLITALRTGTPWETIRANLPGTDPAGLLAAHALLRHRLTVATESWLAIVEHPTADVIAEHVKFAQLVLPGPTRQMATAVTNDAGDRKMRSLVGTLMHRVAASHHAAEQIEARLATLTPRTPAGITLGQQLFHPTQETLWGATHFLPTRVGQLCPTRVADLLIERRPEPGHPWES